MNYLTPFYPPSEGGGSSTRLSVFTNLSDWWSASNTHNCGTNNTLGDLHPDYQEPPLLQIGEPFPRGAGYLVGPEVGAGTWLRFGVSFTVSASYDLEGISETPNNLFSVWLVGAGYEVARWERQFNQTNLGVTIQSGPFFVKDPVVYIMCNFRMEGVSGGSERFRTLRPYWWVEEVK